MYPFLFYIPTDLSYAVGEGNCIKVKLNTWIVKISTIDYKTYESKWMNDPILGKYCLIPDVDQTRETHIFYSEKEALDFIKNWWKCQD